MFENNSNFQYRCQQLIIEKANDEKLCSVTDDLLYNQDTLWMHQKIIIGVTNKDTYLLGSFSFPVILFKDASMMSMNVASVNLEILHHTFPDKCFKTEGNG